MNASRRVLSNRKTFKSKWREPSAMGQNKKQGTRTSSFPTIMEHTTLSVSFFHTTYSHKLNPQNLIPSVSMFCFLASTHPFMQKKVIICIFLKHLNLASTSLFMQVHNSILKLKYFRKKPNTKKGSEDKPALEAAASTHNSKSSF